MPTHNQGKFINSSVPCHPGSNHITLLNCTKRLSLGLCTRCLTGGASRQHKFGSPKTPNLPTQRPPPAILSCFVNLCKPALPTDSRCRSHELRKGCDCCTEHDCKVGGVYSRVVDTPACRRPACLRAPPRSTTSRPPLPAPPDPSRASCG